MVKQSTLYIINKYFLFGILFVLLHFANINGIYPFAFGMLFALVWCNQKIYIVAPIYVFTGLLVNYSVNNILILCSCATVFCLCYFMHWKFKKTLNHILIGCYAFLSQFLYLYLSIENIDILISSIITVVLGIICLYAYLYFMQSLLIRGVNRKYTIDEIVSFSVLLFAIGIGISSISDYNGMISRGIFIFLILLFSYVFNASSSVGFSIVLGLGNLFATNDFQTFLCVTLCALICVLAKNTNKIFVCFGAFLIDIFTNIYFYGTYTIYMFIAICLAILLFMLIPLKSINKIKSIIVFDNSDFGVRNIINRSRNVLYKRIWDISEVFNDMQSVFMSMSKTELLPEQAIQYINTEVKNRICSKCVYKDKCLRINRENVDNELNQLIALALSKRKVTLLDVSSTLNMNCCKIAILIDTINEVVKDYNKYAQIAVGMDNSRVLIAEQLFGVSEVLKSLADEVHLNITFDADKEQKIIEELNYNQIMCSDAVIYYQKQQIKNITLSIKNTDIEKEKISKIVEKVMHCSMDITNIQASEKVGFSFVVLTEKVNYDILFGCAGVLKNGSVKSGDTHSMLRLSNDKILMALCDGMGSGENARKTSSLTLQLIENFYKAGFKSELILSNINKLLAMKSEESFSALDICVFDLKQGICDLVKVGAPISFIKRKNELITIEAGALPLGILNDIKPLNKSYALNEDDIVILVTDGVIDSFSNYEELCSFINNLSTKNPQSIADSIIAECLHKCKSYAYDDMTVLVGRIWRKI